jgi:hypothetical protein
MRDRTPDTLCTPPTPDPRERGEFSADDVTFLREMIETDTDPAFGMAEFNAKVRSLADRIESALPAPAPEVTEAMVEVAVAEFFRSVSGPGGDGHAPRSHATAMRDALTAALRGGAR